MYGVIYVVDPTTQIRTRVMMEYRLSQAFMDFVCEVGFDSGMVYENEPPQREDWETDHALTLTSMFAEYMAHRTIH